MMLYYFKAFHIIGFVAWFAGLFYLVRMFVYHAEATQKQDPERSILTRQFALMESRVYKIICNPAMMITWTCGLVMLYLHGGEWMKTNPWMHIKLLLLVMLTGYHIYCKSIMKKFERGEVSLSAFQFRLLNELPTLFLLAIVLLAVMRDRLNYMYTILGVAAFGLVLFFFAKWYKKRREQAGA
ncbi:MAG: protoporphyrinogen oxidase HemJ [Bacteroidetes bacterium]|nr:MAG: protoporphyrinogen oxidase HemJ [Bacteroidota bacterium]